MKTWFKQQKHSIILPSLTSKSQNEEQIDSLINPN